MIKMIILFKILIILFKISVIQSLLWKKIQNLESETNINIGAEGCRHLAKVLVEMKGLKDLYLGKNNIGEDVKKVIREAWKEAGKHVGGLPSIL